MRFDEASALYAEFGPFYTGMVAPLGEVLDAIGVSSRRSRLATRRNAARCYRPAHRDAGPTLSSPLLVALVARDGRARSAGLARRGRPRTPAGDEPRDHPWHRRRPPGHPRPRRRRAGRGRGDHRHRRRRRGGRHEVETDEEGRADHHAPRRGPLHRHPRPRLAARRRRPPAARAATSIAHRPGPSRRPQLRRSATASGPTTSTLERIPQLHLRRAQLRPDHRHLLASACR